MCLSLYAMIEYSTSCDACISKWIKSVRIAHQWKRTVKYTAIALLTYYSSKTTPFLRAHKLSFLPYLIMMCCRNVGLCTTPSPAVYNYLRIYYESSVGAISFPKKLVHWTPRPPQHCFVGRSNWRHTFPCHAKSIKYSKSVQRFLHLTVHSQSSASHPKQ